MTIGYRTMRGTMDHFEDGNLGPDFETFDGNEVFGGVGYCDLAYY
jgi:hypothetical protein